jgi:hypothetical protein
MLRVAYSCALVAGATRTSIATYDMTSIRREDIARLRSTKAIADGSCLLPQAFNTVDVPPAAARPTYSSTATFTVP